MATYAQFKHVELYKIGHGKNRVPNAPKSSIGELFKSDANDNGHKRNGINRPRVSRDKLDTHSRLFGQTAAVQTHVAPLVTDTVRSHIQFGDHEMNGSSAPSPKHMANGSASSTPSQNGRDIGLHSH